MKQSMRAAGIRVRRVMRTMLAELARLNRFAIADVPNATRRERARIVAAELTRRYRSPNRCC